MPKKMAKSYVENATQLSNKTLCRIYLSRQKPTSICLMLEFLGIDRDVLLYR